MRYVQQIKETSPTGEVKITKEFTPRGFVVLDGPLRGKIVDVPHRDSMFALNCPPNPRWASLKEIECADQRIDILEYRLTTVTTRDNVQETVYCLTRDSFQKYLRSIFDECR